MTEAEANSDDNTKDTHINADDNNNNDNDKT